MKQAQFNIDDKKTTNMGNKQQQIALATFGPRTTIGNI